MCAFMCIFVHSCVVNTNCRCQACNYSTSTSSVCRRQGSGGQRVEDHRVPDERKVKHAGVRVCVLNVYIIRLNVTALGSPPHTRDGNRRESQ